MRGVGLAVMCVTLSACFHSGVTPRSGFMVAQGETVVGMTWTVATWAPGSAIYEGARVSGNSGQRAPMTPMHLFSFNVTCVELWIRHGYAEAEVAWLIGANAIGVEVRREVVDQVSVAAAVQWRPFMDWRMPWMRVGVDASREDVTGGLHLSFGPEAHAFNVPQGPCPGFGAPGCGEYGPGLHVQLTRNELRVHMPIGLVLGQEGQATLGVVPYVNLAAWPARGLLDGGYATVKASGFAERWGVSAVLSGAPPE